jgi:hypothetical protein
MQILERIQVYARSIASEYLSRPYDPFSHPRPINRPLSPESMSRARARLRARASGELRREKYRSTSFLRLGVSAFQFFMACGFPASPRLNHAGSGC